jgi:hypothetical protein
MRQSAVRLAALAAASPGAFALDLVSRVGACGESIKGRDSANNPIR